MPTVGEVQALAARIAEVDPLASALTRISRGGPFVLPALLDLLEMLPDVDTGAEKATS